MDSFDGIAWNVEFRLTATELPAMPHVASEIGSVILKAACP